MKPANASKILGYSISGIVTVVGILLLTGVVGSEAQPAKFRVTFGIVLLLFGIYRFAVTRIRASQAERMDQ
ncbi:MAG: hypothetical protein FJ217_09835 [Ignavibacteria bacterium]|nr:hypothetical protein [Ignavibacteria bacterium]